MFEEEKYLDEFNLNITIGLNISKKTIEEKLKFNLETLTENHLNYLDLNKENKEIIITIKKNSKEKGIISKNWIKKYKNLPSVIIIYTNLGNLIDNGFENMFNSFINEVEKVYNLYLSKNLKVYLIMEHLVNSNINFKKITDSLKNKIFDRLKFIEPQNLKFIPNESVLNYEDLANKILEDSNNFYSSFAQKYKNKIEQITKGNKDYPQEYLVKLYIKLALFSKVFNISLFPFNCFEKAYEILINGIEKDKYIFSIKDERYIFIEMKTIADWLFFNILNSFNLNNSKNNLKFDVVHYLFIHLNQFNIENFFENKNLITFQLKLFNLFWKFQIYNYISKKFSFYQKNSLFIFGIINSLLRLNQYYKNKKKEIDNLSLNFLLDNLTIEESKYIEKVPKFFINKKEINDINQRLGYFYLYLYKKKNINFDEINKNIIFNFKNLMGNFFKTNEKFNFYSFYLGNLFNIFNLNEKEKYFNNIILKNKKLKNFPKIYQNFITQFDELIINNNLDSNDNNNKIINNVLFKLSKNFKITENEKNKFNSILSNNNLNNNNKYKIFYNDLFEIDYNFNKNYVNSFEKIEFYLEIKKKQSEINFNIKEIQLIFNHSNRNFSFKLLNNNNNKNDNFLIKNKYEFIALQKDNILFLSKIIFILENNFILENILKVDKKNILYIIEETPKIEFDKFQQFFDINYKDNSILSENEFHYFNVSILNKNNQNKLKIISIRAKFMLNVSFLENNMNFQNEYNFILLDKKGEIKQKIENNNLIINLENNNNNEYVFEFLLKIKYSNKYLLNFIINYELINLDFPEEKFFYETNHETNIKCINGFILNNNTINSNIYVLNKINENTKKSFLSNHLINYNIEILSQLNDDCFIKDLIINHNKNLEIKTNLLKLLKKKFEQKILANNNFFIPFTIKSFNKFSGSIGTLVLKWSTKDLEKYSNNKIINENLINLDNIFIEKSNYLIENEVKNNNKEYILNITNLNNEIKNIDITFNIKNISIYNNYFLQGLIHKKQIIFPNEKLRIKYEINFIKKILNFKKFKPFSLIINEYDENSNKNNTLSFNYSPNFLKLES